MRAFKIVLICSTVLSVGCSTSPVRTSGFDANAKGIPYHLPSSIKNVEIEVLRKDNTFQDLTFTVTPKLVPDRSRLFYLNSVNDSTFTMDHKISLKNGLLTTLKTVDEGQAGELALSIVESISTIARGLVVAQSESENAFDTTSPVITDEEVTAALGLMQGDKFSFAYEGSSGVYSLPGTVNMVGVESGLVLPSLGSTPSFKIAHNASEFKGIYSKTLTSATVQTKLLIRGNAVKARRLKFYNSEIVSVNKSISQGAGRIASARKAITDSCRGLPIEEWQDLDTIESVIVSLDDRERPVSNELRVKYDDCKSKIQAFSNQQESISDELQRKSNLTSALATVTALTLQDVTVKEQSSIILIPDPDRDVRIPLRRAVLGKTTNDLTLVDGILTSFNSERPAVAVEAAKSIQATLKGLVEIPAELVQLKIDTTGKTKELTEKQIELEDEIDKLEGVQADTRDLERLEALESKQNELNETLAEQSENAQRLREIKQQIEILEEETKRIEAESKTISAPERQQLLRERELLDAAKSVYAARKSALEAELEFEGVANERRQEVEKEIEKLSQLIRLQNEQLSQIQSMNNLENGRDSQLLGEVPIEPGETNGFPSTNE